MFMCIWQLALNHFTGAAGNFLVPISLMSENAFKTVLEIDTVSCLSLKRLVTRLSCHFFENKIGSFNTIKATLSHVRASKGAYIHVSATLHYKGIYKKYNHMPVLIIWSCRYPLPGSRFGSESRCRRSFGRSCGGGRPQWRSIQCYRPRPYTRHWGDEPFVCENFGSPSSSRGPPWHNQRCWKRYCVFVQRRSCFYYWTSPRRRRWLNAFWIL